MSTPQSLAYAVARRVLGADSPLVDAAVAEALEELRLVGAVTERRLVRDAVQRSATAVLARSIRAKVLPDAEDRPAPRSLPTASRPRLRVPRTRVVPCRTREAVAA
jgi:hypothetical protein